MADAESQADSQIPPKEDQNASCNKKEDLELPPVYVTVPEGEINQLKQDATEYKDKYLRLLAEMDNMRKRMQKERQETIQYAAQSTLTEFLPPIDHMENALKFTDQMSNEVKHWAAGFHMILNQFKDVLSSNGVVSFHSEGSSFDPHRHEAIEMIETTDHPPGIVVAETLRGYKMGDKIIRPARVKVSKTPEESTKTTSKENG